MTAVLGIAEAVHRLLVARQRLDQRAIQRVVDQHPIASRRHHLAAVGPKADVMDALVNLVVSKEIFENSLPFSFIYIYMF